MTAWTQPSLFDLLADTPKIIESSHFIEEFRPDYCNQCEVEPPTAAVFLRDHYRDKWGTCRTYLSRANVAVDRAPFASRFTPEALAHQPMGRLPHRGHQPCFLHYCICGHYSPTFDGLTTHIKNRSTS